MSIPCGFTNDGLPVGMQLIGPHNGEASLFSAAALFEEVAGVAGELPIEPRGGIA
jgi:Asp-tRNA(Asn)/Glu-tRNA(Gln) amidotransferase A subunit family amidase